MTAQNHRGRMALFLMALAAGVATLVFIIPRDGSVASATSPSRHHQVRHHSHGHQRARIAAASNASQTQRSAFAVLARAANAADQSNASVREIATHATDDGLDVSGARQLRQDSVGTVWLIPGNGRLCLGEEPANGGNLLMSMTCDTDAHVAARGLAMSIGGQYVGVAPDGVSEIAATDGAGSARQVAVTGNVYRLPAGQYTVRFSDDAGAQEMQFGG